jgi:hypothetical protein
VRQSEEIRNIELLLAFVFCFLFLVFCTLATALSSSGPKASYHSLLSFSPGGFLKKRIKRIGEDLFCSTSPTSSVVLCSLERVKAPTEKQNKTKQNKKRNIPTNKTMTEQVQEHQSLSDSSNQLLIVPLYGIPICFLLRFLLFTFVFKVRTTVPDLYSPLLSSPPLLSPLCSLLSAQLPLFSDSPLDGGLQTRKMTRQFTSSLNLFQR